MRCFLPRVHTEWAAAEPRGSRAEDAEHVLLPHGEVLLAVQLDLAPGVLAEQDPVPRLHVERDLLAGLGHLAGADRDHLALLGLFLGGVGDDDAPVLLVPFRETLDENAVMERAQRGLRSVSHRRVLPRPAVGEWVNRDASASVEASAEDM